MRIVDYDSQKRLADFVRNKKLALFLDFDGTLAEVTEVADETYPTPEMREKLRQISLLDNVLTCCISGRKIEDLKARVNIPTILYSGNHGLEVELDHKMSFCLDNDEISKLREGIRAIKKEFQARHLGPERGGNIEDKDTALTWHYFKVPENEVESTVNEACEIIKSHGYKVFEGVGCLEVRHSGVTKGHAMEKIIRAKLGPDWSASYRGVFIGDTGTDEEGYLTLQQNPTFPQNDLTFVRVLSDPSKPTISQIQVKSVSDVYDLLCKLYDIYSAPSKSR